MQTKHVARLLCAPHYLLITPNCNAITSHRTSSFPCLPANPTSGPSFPAGMVSESVVGDVGGAHFTLQLYSVKIPVRQYTCKFDYVFLFPFFFFGCEHFTFAVCRSFCALFGKLIIDCIYLFLLKELVCGLMKLIFDLRNNALLHMPKSPQFCGVL